MLEEMKKHDVQPDVRTFSLFLNECVKKGKIDTAKLLIQKLKHFTNHDTAPIMTETEESEEHLGVTL